MRFAGRFFEFRCLQLVVAAALLCVACPPSSQGQGTTFINLTIPAPWNDRRPTWVLQASAESILVAQNSRLPDKDDIRVIEITGHEFRSVGKNGDGITGVQGSMLHTAARSPDGRLWIVAEHSRFPNQIQGNQFCLYVFENDQWNLVGPRFGAPLAHSWNHQDHGLRFFSDNRPVTLSIDPKLAGANSTWQFRLRRLEGDRWGSLPGHTYISDLANRIQMVWRANDAWLLEAHETRGRTKLSVRRIGGPCPEEVVGPFELESWASKVLLFHSTVSTAGAIAVHARVGDVADAGPKARDFLRVYHPAGNHKFKRQEVPYPPEFPDVIRAIAWSPIGVLHVVGVSHEKVVLARYLDGHWTQLAETAQPSEFETVFMDQMLFFRDDGLPIVTWERFTTVD